MLTQYLGRLQMSVNVCMAGHHLCDSHIFCHVSFVCVCVCACIYMCVGTCVPT